MYLSIVKIHLGWWFLSAPQKNTKHIVKLQLLLFMVNISSLLYFCSLDPGDAGNYDVL